MSDLNKQTIMKL